MGDLVPGKEVTHSLRREKSLDAQPQTKLRPSLEGLKTQSDRGSCKGH